MLEIGKYHTLKILRETSVGLYLGDESGEDILLPTKYCPERFDIGDEIRVFVYRDNAERKIATTLTPDIHMHEFALLKVSDVTESGAFMDWGLEKQLFVPFREQKQPMEVGRWYVVYLDLDEKTDRLYASSNIEQYLNNNELSVREGDTVNFLVYKKSDLGYSVIVNHKHQGLIYTNEVFKELRVGDWLKGYVKKIREENKLDISLQPPGFLKANSLNTDLIMKALERNQGFLPLTDESSPEVISSHFGISKKAFKKAIGVLYKERKITLDKDGIRLVASE